MSCLIKGQGTTEGDPLPATWLRCLACGEIKVVDRLAKCGLKRACVAVASAHGSEAI